MINRRNFIKSAAAASGLMLLPAWAAGKSDSRRGAKRPISPAGLPAKAPHPLEFEHAKTEALPL